MTDDDAVRMVLHGSPGAFDVLVDRYWSRARRYAHRMLQSADDAEDVVQETFMRAYNGLGGYEPRGRFSAWFYRILANECRAAAARRSRHAHDSLDDVGATIPMPGGDAPPADAPGDTDAVHHALDALEPLLREAFVLRYVEDMSYDQMRAVTGAGDSALRMRVKRARDQLRTLLGGGTA